MKWSWQAGRISGITVSVHWTFLLLLGWIAYAHLAQGEGIGAALVGVVFILAIFACVVLHELGHALAARRFGIRTRDITLLPIGGVARLERIPEEPLQELWVALAGPLVNVGLAALFLGLAWLGGRVAALTEVAWIGGDFLTRLMWVNVALVVFNLLPAFPMDGGRVLRALLAMRMDYVRATQIAASVGQFTAILFGILGFFFNWFLIFIALFVYLGAQGEAHMVQMRSILTGVPVREAMITRFRALSGDEPLSVAVQELLASDQQDFPVMDGERVTGVLTRSGLLRALAEGRRDAPVSEAMQGGCGVVDDTEMLDRVYLRMQQQSCPILPVMRAGRLVGVLTTENVGEWLMIHSSLRRATPRDTVRNVFDLEGLPSLKRGRS
ncbi:MAG: site-2 protease family protein [Planctomycetota bacterium]|jgi:Zn-dependent protease/CBS domain-containing protein